MSGFGGLIGGTIGAIIGAPFGLASVGWAIGSAVGGMIDRPRGQDIEGPRLQDLRVMTSSYGTPIPRVWGAMRVGGNVIWSEGITEHRTEESAGGKGASEPKVTKYSYTATFAIGLCAGPVVGFGRVWADQKLLADFATGHNVAGGTAARLVASAAGAGLMARTIVQAAIAERGLSSHSIRGYLGDETQLADPALEAQLGAGNVPGFRGLAYLVFENLQLQQFGNRVPQIEVEVFGTGAEGSTENVGAVYASRQPSGVTFVGWQTYGGYYDNGAVRWRVTNTADMVMDPDAGAFNYAPSLVSFPQDLPDPTYTTWNFQNRLGKWRIFYARHTSVHGPYYALSYGLWAIDENGAAKVLASETYDGLRWAWVANPSRLYVGGISGADTWMRVYDQNLDLVWSGTNNHAITDYGWSGYLNGHRVVMVEPEERYAWYINSLAQVRLYHIGDDYAFTLVDGPKVLATGDNNTSYVCAPGGIVWVRRSDNMDCFTRRKAPVGSGPSVGQVVEDICELAGLSASDVERSALTEAVSGYALSRPMTARAAIEALAPIYFFDGVESDDVLKFVPRGGSVVASIPAAELAAAEEGAAGGDAVAVTRGQDLELPREVDVSYMEAAREYETGHQYASRVIARGEGKLGLEIAGTLSADKARQVADVVLWDRWTSRERYQLSTFRKYAYLEPTDVIQATDEAGTTYTLRITRIDYALRGLLRIEGVEEDGAVYSSAAVGGEGQAAAQTLSIAGPTLVELLDSPILREADDDPGFYAALYGPLEGWRVGVLFRSEDEGASYEEVATQAARPTLARATTALGDAPVAVWDRGNTVTVGGVIGELVSTTEAGALNGANAALLGIDGRWELLNFVNVTDNGNATYTLDTFIRGRRGTEHNTGNHAIDDRLIVLSSAALSRVRAAESDIGLERLYKALSPGSTLAAVQAVAFTNSGVGLKPHAPVHIKGARDGSGNLTISWIRRARRGFQWRDFVEVPLAEESELYDVEILDGAAVVRTISDLSSASASYTAAEQTADFGAAQTAVAVRVYQRSAEVGRGYAGAATV